MWDVKTKEERLIQTYHDIGYSWKKDSSTSTVAKINTIVNSTFMETSAYEFYLETKIITKFKLKYAQYNTVGGSIARMIVIHKCELVKVINKIAGKSQIYVITK